MIYYNRFPFGNQFALTAGYDDGAISDRRLVETFNKYGIKGTFFLVSSWFDTDGFISFDEIKSLYKNHEVAVHTLTHPRLPDISDDAEVIRQVEQDRLNLSEIVGYDVVGMAYPCGGVNNDDRVAKLIKENTGVKYSRTITCNDNFDLQENLYRFNPTAYHLDFDKLMEMGEKFINMTPDKPQIFYIWGHTYEFDYRSDYRVKFEEFLKLISNRNDIFYGTNKEILL